MRQYSNEWRSFTFLFSTFGNEAPVYIAWGRVSYVGDLSPDVSGSPCAALCGAAATLGPSFFAKSVLALPLRSRVQEWRSESQGGGRMQSSCSVSLLHAVLLFRFSGI